MTLTGSEVQQQSGDTPASGIAGSVPVYSAEIPSACCANVHPLITQTIGLSLDVTWLTLASMCTTSSTAEGCVGTATQLRQQRTNLVGGTDDDADTRATSSEARPD